MEVIHRIKVCPVEGKKFRSDEPDLLIPPECTYINEVMVKGAIQRFINGKSSSEISSLYGISESHARKLSNKALEMFVKIHENNISKLKASMKSYILQIDGTTDAEFSMIVVVRDAIADFTLYAKKCDSESEASIREVLTAIKDKFGVPSGITCALRSGILSAAQGIFPETPIRICLMHFLRDLGKDLMGNYHTDLGILINRAGIKGGIKSILKGLPDYDQATLDEIDQGSCLNMEKAEFIAIRKILEDLIFMNKSSGYGFPFSLRHINFFTACSEAEKKLSDLLPHVRNSKDLISKIIGYLSRVTHSIPIKEIAVKLRNINSYIFQRIRKAFMVPEKGNLSSDKYNPLTDDPIVHENCTVVFGELEVYLKAALPEYMFSAAKIAIERYRKREALLFSQNTDGTVPRTNNGMEIFFRKVRRNVRKRCGNIATGNILEQSGDKLALFQNMGNKRYIDLVFGSSDIYSVFGKYRKPEKGKRITGKETRRKAEKTRVMICNDELSSNPYNEHVWEEVQRFRSCTQS